MTPALASGDVQLWIAAGGVFILLIITVQMRRYRSRLKAKRNDGSEPEKEQAGP